MTDAQRAVQIAASYMEDARQHLQADNYPDVLDNAGLAARQLKKLRSDDGERYQITYDGQQGTITLDEMHGELLRLEGVAHGLMHNYKKGVKALERAVQFNPTEPNHRLCLAQVYLGCGNKKAAARAAREAAELDPNSIELAKEADRVSNTSNLGLRLETFRGSVKTLLILIALGGLCLAVIISVGNTEPKTPWGLGIWVLIFWGAAWWYWRRKRG